MVPLLFCHILKPISKMAIKNLGIIPARFASTRLPGKLLLPILGKTLLQRTFENAQNISILDKILIATDDQRIFEHVTHFGGEAIMTSVTCQNGTERAAEVLAKFPEFQHVDTIVNIQGDEPCVDPKAIEDAVKLLSEDPGASMATLITPLREEDAYNPSIVKCVKSQNNDALYFSRSLLPSNHRQKFNSHGCYYQHIGLYIFRPSFLLQYPTLPSTPLQIEEDLEQLKVLEHGYRIKVAITNKVSLGVNTQEDLIKLEQWLCKQNTFLSQEEYAPLLAKD